MATAAANAHDRLQTFRIVGLLGEALPLLQLTYRLPSKMLVSTIREVPDEVLATYQQLWSRSRELATETGARAWRFRSAGNKSRFIEFVEFDARRDPRSQNEFQDLAERLEDISPGLAEEWRDATAAEPDNADT